MGMNVRMLKRVIRDGGWSTATRSRSSIVSVGRRSSSSNNNNNMNMSTSKIIKVVFQPVEKQSQGQAPAPAPAPPPSGFRFRIVSYNILAQVFIKSSYFPHSPSPCLRWKARSQAILVVLRSLESDFLCLQELDEYESFYKTKLESDGYSSIYIQRGGQKRDGCGIFYKHNSVELLLKEKIEYNDLIDSIQSGKRSCRSEHDNAQVAGNRDKSVEGELPKKNARVQGDPNDPHVRLKRDCVGIVGAFKLKDLPHHLVIVANTHLYWDPDWADVKLAQAKYLLFRLYKFRDLVSSKFGCNPSMVVCGDFNSTPGDEVYQCLVSGSSFPSSDGSHHMTSPFHSVYAFCGGEPPFTNCTPNFTDTIDYIFFSPSEHLKPVATLELPNLQSPDVIGGLPNFLHPSDHLPIGADFEVIKNIS